MPPLEDLPDPEVELASLCLLHWQVGSLLLVPPGNQGSPRDHGGTDKLRNVELLM